MKSIGVNLFEDTTRRLRHRDVPLAVIESAGFMLADALAGEQVRLPQLGAGVVLHATPLGQCVLCCIGTTNNYSIAFGVAAHEACGAKLWLSMSAMPRTVLPALPRLPMPHVPWCAAVDLTGPEEMTPPKTDWVKNFITGVAVAWMDIKGWPDGTSIGSKTS